MNNEEKQICTDSGCNCKGMGLDQKTCDEIVHHLRRAYCDEWLAYLQYWTAAQVVMGFMRPKMSCELMEHANEELEHARMLADRIQTLCGEIPRSPRRRSLRTATARSWHRPTRAATGSCASPSRPNAAQSRSTTGF